MQLTCPTCSAALRLAGAPPAGTRLQCPKCGESFAPDVEDVPEALPAATPRRVVAVEDVDDAESAAYERPRRQPARQQANPMLIAGSIVLGALILVGGAWAIVHFLVLRDKKEPLVFVPPPTNLTPPPFVPPNPVPRGGAGVQPHPPESLAVGKVAPDIEGEDIDGKKFKLSDYRGKIVVLDFWGNW